MKVLLTGGTGFIGSHIAKQLVADGHQLTIMARNENKIPALKTLRGVVVKKALMSDFDLVQELVKGQDAVVHVALDYMEGAVNMLQHDTLGSVHLLEAAAKAGVKQVIYTSSTASVDFVYTTDYGRKTFANQSLDETHCTWPTSFYGATKAATEVFLMAISHTYGMKMNIVRPGYIFGNPAIIGAPIEPDNRFSKLVADIRNNQDVTISKGDGTQFLSAPNIAKVYGKILLSDCNRETFFALGSKFISWEHICQYLIANTKSTSNILFDNAGASEQLTPIADFDYIPDSNLSFGVNKIRDVFGFNFDDEWEHIKEHLHYLLQRS